MDELTREEVIDEFRITTDRLKNLYEKVSCICGDGTRRTITVFLSSFLEDIARVASDKLDDEYGYGYNSSIDKLFTTVDSNYYKVSNIHMKDLQNYLRRAERIINNMKKLLLEYNSTQLATGTSAESDSE